MIFCGRRSFTFSCFAFGLVEDEVGFKLFVDRFCLAPAEDFLHVAAHLFDAEHGAKECSLAHPAGEPSSGGEIVPPLRAGSNVTSRTMATYIFKQSNS